MEGMKSGEENDDDLYMSDTGAEIVKATRERDMFEGTLRGRHGKTNQQILQVLNTQAIEVVAPLDEEASIDDSGNSDREHNKHDTGSNRSFQIIYSNSKDAMQSYG